MLVKPMVAAFAAVSSVALAARTIPSTPRHLKARDHICVNCYNLCTGARNLNEASACTNVCMKDYRVDHVSPVTTVDIHECLDMTQRKELALSLFRTDLAYIDTLSNNQIKDYLFTHVDPFILYGSRIEANAYLKTSASPSPSPPPGDGVKINCQALCAPTDSTYMDNAQACGAVCPYSPKNDKWDCIKELNNQQIQALLRAFFPLNGKTRYSECMWKKDGKERKECFEKALFTRWPEFKAAEYPGAKYC